MKHYLAVAVGDIVSVEFHCPNKTLKVHITEIERRYGKTQGGTRSQNPLVIGINTDTQKEIFFDAGFVTKILERNQAETIYPKKNHFRGYSGLKSFKQKGNRWIGTLTAITVHALGRLPYEFDRPLHEGRVRRLFQKFALGKKPKDDYGYCEEVDGRLFTKWVAKNYTQLVMTSKEYHDFQTRQIIQGEKQMEADMEHWMKMDKDFEESLK